MSWYIQYLLRHREEIRSNIYSEPKATTLVYPTVDDSDAWDGYVDFSDEDSPGRFSFLIEPNFESDYFNDLLLLEKKLIEMYKSGIINLEDIHLIEMVGTNETFPNLEKELGMNRYFIEKKFTNLCTLLSYKMNGIFSDEEVCKRLQEDYHLTDEQVGEVKLYMKSKLKNKIIRIRRKN